MVYEMHCKNNTHPGFFSSFSTAGQPASLDPDNTRVTRQSNKTEDENFGLQ